MLQMREFQCGICGHIQEDLVDKDVRQTVCQECSGVAASILSPVMASLEGVTGDFPGAHMKWDKARRAKLNQELSQCD